MSAAADDCFNYFKIATRGKSCSKLVEEYKHRVNNIDTLIKEECLAVIIKVTNAECIG